MNALMNIQIFLLKCNTKLKYPSYAQTYIALALNYAIGLSKYDQNSIQLFESKFEMLLILLNFGDSSYLKHIEAANKAEMNYTVLAM